jgi:hypothetical protein
MGEAMADNDYSHIASIMEAAKPHVDIKTQMTMELMSKLFGLMGSFQNLKKANIAACGFEKQKINLEGLLTAIRPLCKGKELAMVDQILSMFNAKRMYDTYKTYMETMKTMQGAEGSPFGNIFPGFNTGNHQENSSGFDINSLINGFANMNNFNKQSSTEEKHQDNASGFDISSFLNGFANAKSNPQSGSEQDNTSKSNENYGYSSDNDRNKESDADKTPESETSSYSKMLETLKAMMPPEQNDTYENLSMLLNNVSYDNNNKSESK